MPHALAATALTVICAASSLRNVLLEIKPGLNTRVTTSASSSLARQIQEGAPCDLFFSADTENMNRVKTVMRKDLLSNRLVVIVPKGPATKISKVEDLTNPAFKKIALPEKAVPVGHYARNYLERRGLLSGLISKIVQPADARATLAWVESGNADAGFVYKTDAMQSNKVEIALEIDDLGETITYPLATLNDKPETEEIFQKLTGAHAIEIYKKFGFIVLSPHK